MASLPSTAQLLWPVLKAIQSQPDGISNEDINAFCVAEFELTPEQLSEMHRGGPQTLLQYSVQQARVRLSQIGAIESVRRKIWRATEMGNGLASAQEVKDAVNAFARQAYAKRKSGVRRPRKSRDAGRPRVVRMRVAGRSSGWQDDLITEIERLSDTALQNLMHRLMKASGASDVSFQGQEGSGTVRVGILSFRMAFKVFRQDVQESDVHRFRGATLGRVDQAALITTRSFSDDAQEVARLYQRPPIELIDGKALVELLREHGLGVKKVSVGQVQREFFEAL